MKNLLIAGVLSLGLFIAPSCKSSKNTGADEKNVIKAAQVPTIVQTAFSAKYDGASEIIWEDAHEGDEDSYKVKFKKDGKYWKAEYKADGSLIKEKLDD